MMNRNKLILIVEDELLIARAISQLLNEENWKTQICNDFLSSKLFITSQKVDLVLIDITLKGQKTGIDLAKFIRENYEIPFIYLTALTDKETISQVVETKPFSYLSKPVQKADLHTAVRLAFGQQKDMAIEIPVGKEIYRFPKNDLKFIKTEHVYSKLYFSNGNSMLLRISLSDLLSFLPQNSMLRVNRSFAVNPDFITRKKNKKIYIDNEEFVISDNYKEDWTV